jgi:hypothetical protein
MSIALPLGLGRRVSLPQAGLGGLLAGVAGSARAEMVLAGDFRKWHVPDLPRSQREFGYWGLSGSALDGSE